MSNSNSTRYVRECRKCGETYVTRTKESIMCLMCGIETDADKGRGEEANGCYLLTYDPDGTYTPGYAMFSEAEITATAFSPGTRFMLRKGRGRPLKVALHGELVWDGVELKELNAIDMTVKRVRLPHGGRISRIMTIINRAQIVGTHRLVYKNGIVIEVRMVDKCDDPVFEMSITKTRYTAYAKQLTTTDTDDVIRQVEGIKDIVWSQYDGDIDKMVCRFKLGDMVV